MYRVSKCLIWELPAYKINCVVACVAGTLFTIGWWVLFDLQANYPEFMDKNKIYHIPGIVGTIVLLFNNSISFHSINDSAYYSTRGFCGRGAAIFCLFLGLMVAFGALIGAIYVWIADFLVRKNDYLWPGYAILIQNLFIFASNMLMRFARQVSTM